LDQHHGTDSGGWLFQTHVLHDKDTGMPEPEDTKKQEHTELIRQEDGYLADRTHIFLVASGLLFTAAGVSKDAVFQGIIACLGLIVSFSWFSCTYQSWKIVVYLHKKYSETYGDDEFHQAIQDMLWKTQWMRPTELLSIVLPLVFFLSWSVFLGLRFIL
jgi:hypothetical protein